MNRERANIPDTNQCASCAVALEEPFGWCSNCAKAYCDGCRASHYCNDSCIANGCIAGLCVRTVENGVLAEWTSPITLK